MSSSRASGAGDFHNESDIAKDPAVAGFVGKRRVRTSAVPDPGGNREARRAFDRQRARKDRRRA